MNMTKNELKELLKSNDISFKYADKIDELRKKALKLVVGE